MEFFTRMAKQLMLKEVETSFRQNLVLSPLSANSALNMVAAGTRGRTLESMLGFLGSKTVNEINSKSSEMMAVIAGAGSSNGGEDGPLLSMVTGIWVDKSFPLKPSYREVLKGIHNCEAKNVDFANKADEVICEANSWAATASSGLITNILNIGSLYPHTAALLANGLYFKGTWINKFDEGCTENRDFYLLNGGTVSVPFMTSRKTYHCGSFDGFKVLRIPYQSEELNRIFCMYFFLPDERDRLQNLLVKFNSDSGFLQQNFNLRGTKLDEFWIPKFKFSYRFDVSRAMRDMGLSLAFMENPADFTEIVDVPKGLPFFVSNMFQKADIEIDEKGTEGSAITAIGICTGSRYKLESFSFIADHSFMFVIKEETSGLVFFTGAVLYPISSQVNR